MHRRRFILTALLTPFIIAGLASSPRRVLARHNHLMPLVLSDTEWRERLTVAQYGILRNEDTELPYSSPLNHEKRAGQFLCAGCDLPLFESSTKFESGTGWPSFTQAINGHTETKTDYKMIWPRTEYHCAQCGGHQGHIFNDGPQPTGQRWCNNGLALTFKTRT